jgi:pimeloyl-ACP methyl ester carboxylesterase
MGSFESFDGTRLSYETDGDGTPVLLLHGFATDVYTNWIRPGITDALNRAGFRTIALDQRGHGMSDKPHADEAYADGAMVMDAKALLDHLGLDRVLGLGYSMGARNLLELITSDERVRAAVLGGVGGNMLEGREFGSAISDAMLAEDKSSITNNFARSFRDFADLTRGDRVALAAVMRQPRPPLDGLDRIAIPVLILTADDDPLAHSPEKLASAIAGATTAKVGGTHLNVVNNPAFHRAAVDFLTEHRAAAD